VHEQGVYIRIGGGGSDVLIQMQREDYHNREEQQETECLRLSQKSEKEQWVSFSKGKI
ncbi:conserved hypothetical protein, partial [Ricinus communis]